VPVLLTAAAAAGLLVLEALVDASMALAPVAESAHVLWASHLIGWAKAVALAASAASVLFLGRLLCVEPGYIVDEDAAEAAGGAVSAAEADRWHDAPASDLRHAGRCPTCYVARPPRAGHCKTCGLCVDRLDHHCHVLGQCVGARNFPLFVRYLAVITIAAFAACVWLAALLGLWPHSGAAVAPPPNPDHHGHLGPPGGVSGSSGLRVAIAAARVLLSVLLASLLVPGLCFAASMCASGVVSLVRDRTTREVYIAHAKRRAAASRRDAHLPCHAGDASGAGDAVPGGKRLHPLRPPLQAASDAVLRAAKDLAAHSDDDAGASGDEADKPRSPRRAHAMGRLAFVVRPWTPPASKLSVSGRPVASPLAAV
jgi:hypothetical protein